MVSDRPYEAFWGLQVGRPEHRWRHRDERCAATDGSSLTAATRRRRSLGIRTSGFVVRCSERERLGDILGRIDAIEDAEGVLIAAKSAKDSS
jgi:hypothetical protein